LSWIEEEAGVEGVGEVGDVGLCYRVLGWIRSERVGM